MEARRFTGGLYCAFWPQCKLKKFPARNGALYSVAKAVPGFLQVSDFWQWLINNAVALFSGLSHQECGNGYRTRLDGMNQLGLFCVLAQRFHRPRSQTVSTHQWPSEI
eukprot:3722906-Amphidinium_carterae.1